MQLIEKAPQFFITVFFISFLLIIIEIVKAYDPKLIGPFGFISGSFFLIHLLQYAYIHHRANKYVESFLLHSVVGFFSCFILGILLVICVKFLKIHIKYIILAFVIINILVLISYIYFFRNLF